MEDKMLDTLMKNSFTNQLLLTCDAGTGLSLSLLAAGFLLSAQNSPAITLHPADPLNSTCRQYT